MISQRSCSGDPWRHVVLDACAYNVGHATFPLAHTAASPYTWEEKIRTSVARIWGGHARVGCVWQV